LHVYSRVKNVSVARIELLDKLFYLSKPTQDLVDDMAETIKSVGDTLAELIEKLAGKGTNLQLTFKDLTLEWAGMKTKLNGSIILDVLYVSEKK
jgi:endonuclease IV